MKSLLAPEIARYRMAADLLPEPYRTTTRKKPERGGAFRIERNGVLLCIIAGIGRGWDHVSVHARPPQSDDGLLEVLRTPTWAEMDFIKRIFFLPHEVAIQIHPAEDKHVNIHEATLHLWRPHRRRIPLPPRALI